MKLRHAAPALLMLLAGCSSDPATSDGDTRPAAEKSAAADSSAKLPDLDSLKLSAAFTVRWHHNIGNVGTAIDYSAMPLSHPGEVRWRAQRDVGAMGNSILQPAVLDGALYVANAKGKLLRLNAASGEQDWRIDTGVTVTGGVGAGGGLIVVGGEKGDVLAYGADGNLRWRALVSSEVLGAPQVSGGVVVVRSGDGHMTGLNAADGKRKWLYEHSTPALVVRSSAPATIRGSTIFAGLAGGKVVALDLASGNLKWEATLSEPRGHTELERISDITSAPQADDDVVCAVSFQGRVGCFGAAQGNLMWSHELSSDKGLALLGGNIYIADADGVLLAMDKTSGSSLWKNAQLARRKTAAPAALGEYLVAGDKEGYIDAFRRDDGSLAARLKTDGSPILGAPIELDGGLLVQTRNGGLYSVTLH